MLPDLGVDSSGSIFLFLFFGHNTSACDHLCVTAEAHDWPLCLGSWLHRSGNHFFFLNFSIFLVSFSIYTLTFFPIFFFLQIILNVHWGPALVMACCPILVSTPLCICGGGRGSRVSDTGQSVPQSSPDLLQGQESRRNPQVIWAESKWKSFGQRPFVPTPSPPDTFCKSIMRAEALWMQRL